MELEDFKKEYSLKAKKFKLPDFGNLEENFEMGKVETDDLVLRSVRKTMMERAINTLGFFEMLLNPMNAPRMYHGFLNSLTTGDTKKIEEMYAKLAGLSVASLEREIDYSEKGEAELIVEISKTWDSIKPDFKEILGKMKSPGNGNNGKRERSYFG
ncbi:MAG: hypothetical protein KC506_03825 [Nanoarchaeota archaeon]|nr:hypothetical protein [Nanoarchaeota archaeon]